MNQNSKWGFSMNRMKQWVRTAALLLSAVLLVGCAVVFAAENTAHRVTFHLNYVGAGTLDVQQVTSGALLTPPETPVRDGYVFTGLYTNITCNHGFDFSTPVTENLRLFAGWKPLSVQVIYYLLNDKGDVLTLSAVPGELLTPPDEPVRDGYAFTGWYRNAAGSLPYDFSQPVPEHDLTIYAGYTQKKATVTFVLYDDESMTEQVELGGMMHRPDDPIRDGYAFAGWYTMATGGDAVDFAQPVPEDRRVFAHWEKTAATVTFDAQTGETQTELVTIGQIAAQPQNPARTGYDFDAWYSDAACTNRYDFAQTVTEDMTLYAGWTLHSYTVSFDPNDGSGQAATQTVAYGEQVQAADDPVRDGYDFIGWYNDAEGTARYRFTDAVIQDMTLYAAWQKKEESSGERIISYQYNYDDLGEYTTQTYKATRKMRAPDNPVRPGYYFAGWTRDPEGTIPFDFASERSTSSFTLYARWLKGYTFEAEYTYLDGKPGQGTSDNCMGVDLIQTPKDVLGNGTKMGMSNDAYVGKLYYNGAYLDFCIHSETEVADAVLVARLTPDLFDMRFTDETWQVLVNGEPVKYGRLNLTGSVAQTDFDAEGNTINGDMFKRPFSNYVLTTTLHLQAGENTIRLLTNNNEDHGGTFNAESPLIDCLYIYADTELTWSKCYPENVGKTMDDISYAITYDTESK